MGKQREDFRSLLEALGVSISHLAEEAEVSRTTIHSLLEGGRAYKSTLKALAEQLGVDLDRVKSACAVSQDKAKRRARG